MIDNGQNGGLVLRTEAYLYITDIMLFKGTYQIDMSTGEKKLMDALGLSLVCDDNNIYFINQFDNDKLYKYSEKTNSLEKLGNKSISKVMIYDERLMYLDDSSGSIFSSTFNGDREKKVISDNIIGFTIDGDELIYKTNSCIKKYNFTANSTNVIVEGAFLNMFCYKQHLFALENKSSETYKVINFDGEATKHKMEYLLSNFCGNEDYIYCTDSSDSNCIYRLDSENYSGIRIHNSNSEGLHLIEDNLFFITDGKWHVMNIETYDIEVIDLEVM